MNVIAGNVDANHTYFEQNETMRNTTIIEFNKKFNNKNNFKIKQSLSYYDRKISLPNYSFSGLNTNAFSDISYLWNKEKQTIITGINLLYDNFKQRNTDALNSASFTSGVYIQHTWDISEKIKLENGLRLDNVYYSNNNFFKNQTFILPRISALYKISTHWSSRIGGGFGYKIPTIFTEKTETMQYQNILSLNNVEAEKSIGGTLDVNFKSLIFNDLLFSVNQLFFLTDINKPLILQNNNADYFFTNSAKNVVSKGFETNLKFIFKEELKFFAGYTFTDAKANYLQGNQFLPLLPKNKVNLALIYEKENNFKFGLEGYFTDHQYLYNGTETPTFWEFGFMAEKTVNNKLSVFVNFENFTDTRQSNYKTIVNPPRNNPTFDDIWTHTEGFTINGGIKIKL